METLEEKQKYSVLLDVYGALLTDRQRDFLELYYNEDISYGEIAETEDISRQAVHDTIHHGKKALLHFEEHLGLAARQSGQNQPERDAIDLEALQNHVKELSRLVNVDITYDMLPIQKSVKKLRELVGIS